MGAGASRETTAWKLSDFSEGGWISEITKPSRGCRWWTEFGEKRKDSLVQKDEGRSLGLRGKYKFLGLVERVREDRRKMRWF